MTTYFCFSINYKRDHVDRQLRMFIDKFAAHPNFVFVVTVQRKQMKKQEKKTNYQWTSSTHQIKRKIYPFSVQKPINFALTSDSLIHFWFIYVRTRECVKRLEGHRAASIPILHPQNPSNAALSNHSSLSLFCVCSTSSSCDCVCVCALFCVGSVFANLDGTQRNENKCDLIMVRFNYIRCRSACQDILRCDAW